MARLKHATTGVIVNVDDSKVDRLGSEWAPADGSARTSTAARSETPDGTWKVADLRGYADDNGIDLGSAKTKPEILDAIASASTEASESDDKSGDENS